MGLALPPCVAVLDACLGADDCDDGAVAAFALAAKLVGSPPWLRDRSDDDRRTLGKSSKDHQKAYEEQCAKRIRSGTPITNSKSRSNRLFRKPGGTGVKDYTQVSAGHIPSMIHLCRFPGKNARGREKHQNGVKHGSREERSRTRTNRSGGVAKV